MTTLLTAHRDLLVGKKILLAYSGGVDSSALFHLLVDEHMVFDIAIVDYGIREQSKEEVEYAKELSNKHNLVCHSKQAPKFSNDFEANARAFRYRFFEELIEAHGYEILLTAHQLNDQLEWFLMRLAKGAGASELVGLHENTHRENYTIIRPLLSYSKAQLAQYLEQNNHRYFIDSSNSDEVYERNYFRNNFSDRLIAEYGSGIKKSFEYLKNDISILKSQYENIFSHGDLRVVRLSNIRQKSKAADISLKELGYLMSASQREEINRSEDIVIGGKWAVCTSENILYIAPYIKTIIPKKSRELYRVAKIPPLIRGYCYANDIAEIL